jgi:hypothetical protein
MKEVSSLTDLTNVSCDMAISLSPGELLALMASTRLCPSPTPVTWRLYFLSRRWLCGGGPGGGGVGVGVGREDVGPEAVPVLVGEGRTL